MRGTETARAYAATTDAAVEHVPVEHRQVAAPAIAQPVPQRRSRWRVQALLIQADLFALLLAFFTSAWIFEAGARSANGLRTRELLFLITLPVWLVALNAAGLYDRDEEVIGHTTLDEIPRLTQIATMGVWGFVVATWALGVGLPSIEALLLLWALAILLFPGLRALARLTFQRHPDYPQNTIIVGAGSVGQLLARKLMQHPEYRINMLGFVDEQPTERRNDLADLTIVGVPAELPKLVDRLALERVIVAFSNESTEDTMNLIRLLKDYPVRIDIVPRLFDVIPPRLTASTIEGVPLLTLPPLRLSRWSRSLKRALDIAIASTALIILSPVFAVIAVLIKLDSAGPVLFLQLRMGADERPFWMLKFRTMAVDADARKGDFAHLNKHLHPGGDPRMFKIPDDPRMTAVGRVLRRYSLDELPQLFNVVGGSMSLIGPRPLILEEDRHIDSWGRKRLLLKPGMTGLWQVLGRSAIPFEEMVKLDYLYVTTWSLANDCKLLLQTIPLVLRGPVDDVY